MSKNKILLAIIVIAIILAGVFYMYKKSSNQEVKGDYEVNAQVDDLSGNSANKEIINDEATEATPEETQPSSNIKEFEISGNNFSFSLKEIKVKKGDKVKIVFNNIEGFHDLIIDEFSVNTGRISAGQSKTVEFTADKIGTFEYYCSVGQHRANGMFGKLLVE